MSRTNEPLSTRPWFVFAVLALMAVALCGLITLGVFVNFRGLRLDHLEQDDRDRLLVRELAKPMLAADTLLLVLAGLASWAIARRRRAELHLKRNQESFQHNLKQLVAERTAELARREESERKLAVAVEQSPVTIVVTDLEGRIEYVNPKFVELTGFAPEEVVGQNPRMLKSGQQSPEFYADLWNTIRAGREWRGEFCNRKKNGDLYWESACISPVRSPSGEVTHYVAIKSDVTAARLAAEELRRAKETAEAANRAKSVFLAGMSHEIRTPLNAILGFSQVLRGDPTMGVKQHRQLTAINQAGEHLLGLINDILEVSKIEAGHVEVRRSSFDLIGLIGEAVAMFRQKTEAAGVELATELVPDLPRHVVCDQQKLRQILINLLGNAVKFTRSGRITLRASARTSEAGHLELAGEVEDTGIGIAAEEMSKLFGVFEQTSSGQRSGTGSGLGLALSRQYARLLGGELDARSEPGQGSTFRFVVPIERGEPDPSTDSRPHRRALRLAPQQAMPKVLIVDDTETSREVLLGLLALIGIEARTAENGLQGLEMVASWGPSLVFMDLAMPVMDGYEATRRIKATPEGRTLPVIALTASAYEEQRHEAVEAGCSDFLRKPIREAELHHTLEQHLGLRFVYEEGAGVSAPPAREADLDPTARELRSLPANLLEEMRAALRSGYLDRLAELAMAVGEKEPRLASTLEDLIERYDYDRMHQLLDAAPPTAVAVPGPVDRMR